MALLRPQIVIEGDDDLRGGKVLGEEHILIHRRPGEELALDLPDLLPASGKLLFHQRGDIHSLGRTGDKIGVGKGDHILCVLQRLHFLGELTNELNVLGGKEILPLKLYPDPQHHTAAKHLRRILVGLGFGMILRHKVHHVVVQRCLGQLQCEKHRNS